MILLEDVEVLMQFKIQAARGGQLAPGVQRVACVCAVRNRSGEGPDSTAAERAGRKRQNSRSGREPRAGSKNKAGDCAWSTELGAENRAG